jgi:ATP-dependent metalloprotease
LRAMKILQDHRMELNRLADALLEYETLSKDEIVSICRGEKLKRSKFIPEKKEQPEESREKIERIVKTRGFTIFFNKE